MSKWLRLHTNFRTAVRWSYADETKHWAWYSIMPKSDRELKTTDRVVKVVGWIDERFDDRA